ARPGRPREGPPGRFPFAVACRDLPARLGAAGSRLPLSGLFLGFPRSRCMDVPVSRPRGAFIRGVRLMLRNWLSSRNPSLGSLARRSPRRCVRPTVEALEDRCLLATFTVTNNSDAGPGSLRDAILSSNATSPFGPANTIVFDPAIIG